jgi:hypothetical protein
MFDGLSRFANRLGESILFVVMAPLSIVIHLDEMAQGATGTEQLLFRIMTLDFGGEDSGHRMQCGAEA